jgi:hypothetical protein
MLIERFVDGGLPETSSVKIFRKKQSGGQPEDDVVTGISGRFMAEKMTEKSD